MDQAIDLFEYGQRFAFGLVDAAKYEPVPLDPQFGSISVQKIQSYVDPVIGRGFKVTDVPVIRFSESEDEATNQLLTVLTEGDVLDNIFTVG